MKLVQLFALFMLVANVSFAASSIEGTWVSDWGSDMDLITTKYEKNNFVTVSQYKGRTGTCVVTQTGTYTVKKTPYSAIDELLEHTIVKQEINNPAQCGGKNEVYNPPRVEQMWVRLVNSKQLLINSAFRYKKQ